MENNIQILQFVIDYIEEHISECISLDDLAHATGYSKYHLHRMFSEVIGLTIHQYMKRRQLTEAARKLVYSEEPIIQIAFDAGYNTQQSFLQAFKGMYKLTPQKFRKMHQYRPIQLKFEMSGNLTNLKGDKIMDIEMVEREKLYFAGFKGNTSKGFFIIPKLWHKLNKKKNRIKNKTNMDFTVGINDYSGEADFEKTNPAFDYYAAVEVNSEEDLDKDMSIFTLPASKYVVFIYKGKAKDSMQPVMDYIYKEWFPKSNSRLNEQARADFVRYSEKTDEKGESRIEVWIPITA